MYDALSRITYNFDLLHALWHLVQRLDNNVPASSEQKVVSMKKTNLTGFSIEGGTRRLIAAYFGIYSRLLCV